MLVIRAEIHIKLVRIVKSEDPDQSAQKQSDLSLLCLSWPFRQASSVRNFRTSMLIKSA